MGEWIDFRKLRQQLDFSSVLEKYAVRLNGRGIQQVGTCPLPGHTSQRNKQSFSVNLEKGIFQCFSCKAKGNILDFACLMENRDPSKGSDLRTTALELSQRFSIQTAGRHQDTAQTPVKPKEAENGNIVVNAPLDFALKNLDSKHPYLAKRGLSPATISRFGLGFCSRGQFQDRIVIPLHSRDGIHVGYAGRLVHENDPKLPKYLFPGRRTHNEVVYDFKKTLLLYNAHRIEERVDDLIIVEGFMSVFWLTQNGFGNVVALMGWSMSEEQERIIHSLVKEGGTIILLFEGDKAGTRARETLSRQLEKTFLVTAPVLPPGKQPTDLSDTELEALICGDRGKNGKAEMICELINEFQCLRHLRIRPETWNAEDFERQSAKFSSGEVAAAQFVLGIWNPATRWKCGKFDLIEAAYRFDEEHRRVIIKWLGEPWWP